MIAIYIDESFNARETKEIKEIIHKYNGVQVENIQQAEIVIQKTITVLDINRSNIKIYSKKFLTMMDNELINPLTYQSKSNCLINNYLKNKTFGFYNLTDAEMHRYKALIKMMDGEINSINPEYLIANKHLSSNKDPINENIILVSWIDALIGSTKYIYPKKFLLTNMNDSDYSKKKEQVTPNIEKVNQRSNFTYTLEFFEEAKRIQQTTKLSFPRLKKEMIFKYPNLAKEDNEIFKEACQIGFARMQDAKYVQDSSHPIQDESPSSLFSKKSNYKIMSNTVLSGPFRHKGRWSQRETRQLIFILRKGYSTKQIFQENAKIDWPYVAMHVNGRTPKMCMDKYRELINKHQIEDLENDQIKDFITEEKFNKRLNKAFTPNQEKEILSQIQSRINDGKIVTSKDISTIAFKYFYSPLNLCLKAITKSYFDRNEWPFDSKGNINIPNLQQTIEEILPIALEYPKEIIRRYQIPEFKASFSWTYKFMKRNGLVFRVAHFERRGKVNEEDVNEFLEKVADALCRYKKDHILNLDESFINTFNPPSKQIAFRGQATVKFAHDKLNVKEGTTYLATVTMDPSVRIPLFIVAKGKTELCHQKYEFEEEEETEDYIFHSLNGWTTCNVMMEYLEWISKQMNEEPIALLLDSYKAHMKQSVIDFAKEHKIELIFIPPCGTSVYQPLDRFIFGVLKQKLRSYDMDLNEACGPKRFQIIHKKVSDVFKEMNDNIIKKAWEIPGLQNYIYRDDDDDDPDYIIGSDDES